MTPEEKRSYREMLESLPVKRLDIRETTLRHAEAMGHPNAADYLQIVREVRREKEGAESHVG